MWGVGGGGGGGGEGLHNKLTLTSLIVLKVGCADSYRVHVANSIGLESMLTLII